MAGVKYEDLHPRAQELVDERAGELYAASHAPGSPRVLTYAEALAAVLARVSTTQVKTTGVGH